jgi:hypothetical protein
MKRLKMVTVAVLLIGALSAVAAASASAADQLAYTGNGKFSLGSGSGVLETASGLQITCTSDSGNGVLASPSPATTALLTVSFKGCKSAGKACTSEGQASGTVQTKTLEATFLLTTAGAGAIRLTPDPATGTAFLPPSKCGSIAFEVEGSVIGTLKEASSTELTAGFLQTSGVQAITKAKKETEEFSGQLKANLGSGLELAGLESTEALKPETGTVTLTV